MLTSKENKCIQIVRHYVESVFIDDETGHDYEHIKRVVTLTTRFITNEDAFVAIMIAYMHDLFDDKLNKVDSIEEAFASMVKKEGLDLLGKDKEILKGIMSIGFRGGFNTVKQSPEAVLVSDADYLDAMGAIGIARCFYYAGTKGHPIYDAQLDSVVIDNEQAYRNEKRNAIRHFDEKLLKLKDRIQTPSAQEMANDRHQFLLEYYQRFWDEVL
ncbi:HD domain-containing protein [Erysipelothrix urinaevulpis]|uniref:HD domain-containing protein n=1 Tax=Erysipelothrix urinaevulpis TaxID=2683717 RepID=UPI001358B5E2|nr:HD domain-containing protein [Erysipelothrix urinaevulpis]